MIAVRRVVEEDSRIIFEWRNDIYTRKMSRASEHVDWKRHSDWLYETLRNPNRCLLLCEAQPKKPIAVVRFDVKNILAEISINLSPLERGRGLSSMCLSVAIGYFEKHYPLVLELIAEIKTVNLHSRKSFERVGFVLRTEKDGYWHLSSHINR